MTRFPNKPTVAQAPSPVIDESGRQPPPAVRRYWATRCWYWGRAIWLTEPTYSPTFRQFRTEPEGPPFAADRAGSAWVVDFLWPANSDSPEEGKKTWVDMNIRTS